MSEENLRCKKCGLGYYYVVSDGHSCLGGEKHEFKNKKIRMKNKTTDLAKRRGKIALARVNITKPHQPTLKALFENFYPVHIENKIPSTSIDGGELWYYGISPLFRVVNEGEAAPEYEARFRRFTRVDEESEDRVVLEEMKEV